MVLGLFTILQCVSNAGDFTIEGHVSRQLPAYGNRQKAVYERHDFSMTVIGCRWLIWTTQHGGPFDWSAAGTDGTNVYFLVSIGREVTRLEREGKRKGKNVAVANVFPGTVPQEIDETVIPLLWFTYGSACYLRSAATNRIPQLYPTGAKNPYSFRATTEAAWELHRKPPFLPNVAVAWSDGTVDWWENPASGPWVKPPIPGKLPPPYDEGYTNFVFHRIASTNVEGMELPQTSRFVRYAPVLGSKTRETLRVQSVATIELEKVNVAVASDSTLPGVPGETACADYRFALDEGTVLGYVNYAFSDRWLNNAEVKALPDFQKHLESRNRGIKAAAKGTLQTHQAAASVRYVVRACLAVSALMICWVVFRAYRHRTEKGNT